MFVISRAKSVKKSVETFTSQVSEQGKPRTRKRRSIRLVTAQEIYRTLKNNREKSRRIICFFRELTDVDQLDSKFRETDETNEIPTLLSEIKTDLKNSIDPEDIYTYQVRRSFSPNAVRRRSSSLRLGSMDEC